MLAHAALRATESPRASVCGVIDRESPEPPWRQLEGLLRAQIESGELRPGQRLPALVDLAETYDLAVSTVQKAMQALKDAGLVVTSAMGTFIAK